MARAKGFFSLRGLAGAEEIHDSCEKGKVGETEPKNELRISKLIAIVCRLCGREGSSVRQNILICVRSIVVYGHIDWYINIYGLDCC